MDFFVLSSGRSGSRSVAEALSGFEDCVCAHHPQPEPIARASAYWHGKTDGCELLDLLAERRRVVEQANFVQGEANLQWSLVTGLIRRTLPNTRFVWVLRDGRDSVASMYDRGWYDPAVDPVRRPEWSRARLRGDRDGADSVGEIRIAAAYDTPAWEATSRFEKCCWVWRTYNQVLGQLAEQTAHCRMVRLDRLQSELPSLRDFLQLSGSCPTVYRTNIAKQPVSYWNVWSKADRETFERVCGQAMDSWIPEWRAADGSWQALRYDSDQALRMSQVAAAVKATRPGALLTQVRSRLRHWLRA